NATRRSFLTSAVGAGAALGLAACGDGPRSADGAGTPPTGSIAPRTTAAPPAAAPPAPGAAPSPPVRLFSDESMNFDALFGLGESSYGISEAGELVTAVDQANAAGAG